MNNTVDVVVIGAGVTGMSIAWHLVDAGVRALVVERTGVGAGQSSIQLGGVRTQWTAAETIRMAQQALAFYQDIGATLRPSVDPAFDPCGYAFVATTQQTMLALAAGARLQQEMGSPTEVLGPDEMARRVPALRTAEVLGGTYNAHDGYFDRPDQVAAAFAEAARRRGVRLMNSTVDALRAGSGGWRVELADGRHVEAAHAVVAAGRGQRIPDRCGRSRSSDRACGCRWSSCRPVRCRRRS